MFLSNPARLQMSSNRLFFHSILDTEKTCIMHVSYSSLCKPCPAVTHAYNCKMDQVKEFVEMGNVKDNKKDPEFYLVSIVRYVVS